MSDVPIEIRELVIRATVEADRPSRGPTRIEPPEEALITECVEQVLDVLRKRKER